MQVDDPPYLSVGTAVSAKYKGAFCEAKVSKVVRIVKCKVTYKMGLGNATLSDEQIKGTLRVGQLVQAKHPDKKELVHATITKIQDCSQYTVVFDDGDITTLRRTALCLKSGRHFNESETLDQLPLTHPEHFGNPVVGGRRGRRNRQLKEDSSDGEVEEENEPDLEGYVSDIGRVVSVEATDKKRSKDNWFPGLVVIPSAQPTVRINVKDEYLVRSFKDGRYYTVPKKEVTEFSRDLGEKVESSVLAEAVQKALKFLDNNELPAHWERSLLFNSMSMESESDENFTDSSDDEPCEEKDRFVAQLYKFMDDAGTPLNKTPTIAAKDIDLHRLFRVVQKLGGGNRVTNQNKWRSVTGRLHLPNNQSTFNQVKSVYKKCLASYETFYRTLGVTMLNHTRPNKKNRGRSLIRDKDRTPINSPRPDKEEETAEKPEEKKEPPVVQQPTETPKVKKKQEVKEEKKKINIGEISDTNSSDATDQGEPIATTSKDSGRPKRERTDSKTAKEKKVKGAVGEKVKALVEKFEEQNKKEEDDKGQQTRSRSMSKLKEASTSVLEKKTVPRDPKALVKTAKKVPEEEKKRGRKRTLDEKVSTGDSSSDSLVTNINIGDKLKVYYGPTHESKVTYEAKVIEIDKDQSGPVYLVHYTGWNTRYDEWIQPQRIAENLSATTKAKRLKQGNAAPSTSNKSNTASKMPAKRGRGMSITGRNVATEAPRSTTPSSVTSSSSRTKSPATPATRSASRLMRQDSVRRTRRISAQTDISTHSGSESDVSVSESELTRTRSGAKAEEVEIKTYKRKIPKSQTPKIEKRKDKDDDDTEKEEECDKVLKRSRKIKRSPEKSAEESEDEINPPKGRDFDLNQIRSELKGFTKAIKAPSIETIETEALSSSEDSTNPPILEKTCIEDEPEDTKKEKVLEKSSSSEDIYEFKEPEPFEFESRAKLVDDKTTKKRLVPRIFDDLDKSPKKKNVKSPSSKSDKQESPIPERKSFRRTPIRKPEIQDDSDDDDNLATIMSPQKEEDPFDKLVESPSFNLVKTSDKVVDKAKVVKNILDEPLSLFRELPETVDDYSRDMELSDCESQTQIFTTSEDLFSDTFSKSSPDRNTLDMEFSSGKTDECKLKDSDDDDMIRAQIQRVIAQSSSTDDDSNDALMITPSTSSYQVKKQEVDTIPLASILGISSTTQVVEVAKVEEPEVKEETVEPEEKKELPPPVVEKSLFAMVKQTISPALQETDSTLLESIVSQPTVSLNVKLEETAKELINVKTGTKIADSILQKFNSIKNKTENKPEPEPETSEVSKEPKQEFKFELPKEETEAKNKPGTSPKGSESPKKPEVKPESPKLEREKSQSPKFEQSAAEPKKRRKVVSRAYIEESDTDSNDSEQLIIARSDDDSQTNSMHKSQAEFKESDNSNAFAQMLTTDDSQSQEERNFNFDIKNEKSQESQVEEPPEPEVKSEILIEEEESVKEEEPDPQLHSLLLCEEEIPRSPAPPTEPVCSMESKPTKSVLEMPFASAPGTSNSKSMLHLEHKKVPPPLDIPVERENRADASAVLDNTPPTTPESTISTPSGDNGDLSPNGDNESCKSNDAELEYPKQRRNSAVKVSPYSEEDTQLTNDTCTVKKLKDELTPASCKKRRKSLRAADEAIPSKRGRKPQNRSRHNSDSDDTSEHSNTGSTNIGTYERSARSPRPSKYNFFVEFDPSLDSGQRIAVLQQKLSELRKTYADVKAELAAVERRRKKIRRREREALKAAKQEMACA